MLDDLVWGAYGGRASWRGALLGADIADNANVLAIEVGDHVPNDGDALQAAGKVSATAGGALDAGLWRYAHTGCNLRYDGDVVVHVDHATSHRYVECGPVSPGPGGGGVVEALGALSRQT